MRHHRRDDPYFEAALDAFLREATFVRCLRWAADEDGLFIQSRLECIAAARGYRMGWVYYMVRKTLDEALIEYWEWLDDHV